MTKQQIFEKVWDHFVTEKSPPSLANNACMYRQDMTPGCPVRCAAGLFIPDELYNREMECLKVEDVVDRFPDLEDHLGDGETLRGLQVCHDTSARSDNFTTAIKSSLTRFANGRNLTIPSE